MVDLVDRVFDMAIDGEIRSVAMILVTEPGKYRIAAAGPDVDGMCSGAKALHNKLQAVIDAAPKSVILAQ